MIIFRALLIFADFFAVDTILATIGFLMFGDRGFSIGYHAVGTSSEFLVAILILKGWRGRDFKQALRLPRTANQS